MAAMLFVAFIAFVALMIFIAALALFAFMPFLALTWFMNLMPRSRACVGNEEAIPLGF